MKISNFRDYKKVGDNWNTQMEYATVDATTGFLFWKKTKPMRVSKSYISSYWQFLGTGKFTPGYAVEELYDLYKARKLDE